MDYEGKYFPDEPNENQSKTSRNVKRVFKFLFYGAVVAVYIACFAALLSGCESKVWKEVSLSDKAKPHTKQIKTALSCTKSIPQIL